MARKTMSTNEGGRDASGSQSGLDQQPLEVRHLVLHFTCVWGGSVEMMNSL